jgi:hypothetical protein
MNGIDRMLLEMEGEAELQSIKGKMAAAESSIRQQVSDEVMVQLLEWESLWGSYVSFQADFFFEKCGGHEQCNK